MKPRFEPAGAWKAKPWELALRFTFGGAVTAATGLVAHYFGPGIGGLCLAFPAILPASLTLVQEHESRREAVEDARGACLGSIGLAAFALLVAATASMLAAPVVLTVATMLWVAACLSAWAVVHGRAAKRSRRAGRSTRQQAVHHSP
jgi:hypothetical protein